MRDCVERASRAQAQFAHASQAEVDGICAAMAKAGAANAYALYERFRPEIPAGTRGWGAKGVLDLTALAKLGRSGAAKRG